MTQAPNGKFLSQEYQDMLTKKHAEDNAWGNTGARYLPMILEVTEDLQGKSILDYGCGKGFTGQAFREQQQKPGSPLKKISYFEYDPGIPEKANNKEIADIIACTDVLEHIEPTFLTDVLSDMSARTKIGGLLVISCRPALHLLPDGRNAHLIVETPQWWAQRLQPYFQIVNSIYENDDLYLKVVKHGHHIQPVKTSDMNAKARELLNYANAAMGAGDNAEAARLYSELLNHIPGNAQQLCYAGAAFYNIKNFTSAIAYLEKAYKLDKKNSDIVWLYSSSLLESGNATAAEKIIRPYYLANLHDPKSFDLLGAVLNRAQRWIDIIGLHQIWNDNNPKTPYPLIAYAREVDALVAIGDPKKALSTLESIESTYKDDPDFWTLMGYASGLNRQFEREVTYHEKRYNLVPHDSRMVTNYGVALANLNYIPEAIALFDKALAANPNLAGIYVNRAYANKKRQNLDAVIADLKMAIDIEPISASAQYALGCAYIQTEDYASGWPHYEWNWQQSDMPKFRPTSALPGWYGENLDGKHLLVHVEQGVGDTIMFARYIPELLARYKNLKLSIICEGKLLGLLKHSLPDGITYMVKEDLEMNAPIAADYMVAFGSLPTVFETTITTVPGQSPYIKARTPKIYKTADSDIVIGITWKSKSLDAGYKRSIDLSAFAFLNKFPNVKIIDLQYGDTTEERASTSLSFIHDETVDAWDDMQAHIDQIAACDLIISVDNTTVHAAGALGKPVWTLLPYDSYWRWHLDHESTPWYPTMRLFRQSDDRDFAPVLKRVEAELTKLAAGDTSVLTPALFKTKFKAKPQKQKTALLLNDTTNTYHWGCTATSQALRANIAAKGYTVNSIGYYEINQLAYPAPLLMDFDFPIYLSEFRFRDPTLFYAIEKADIVVINGEGTIHGDGPLARRLLYLAYVAKTHFGKPVHIINHACFPEDSANLSDPKIIAYYLKTYRTADYICVRDPISHNLLSQLGISNTLGFDSLPLTARDWIATHPNIPRKKHIILAGSSNFSETAANAYRAAITDLKSDGYDVSVLIGAKIYKAEEDEHFCAFIAKIFENTIPVIDAKSMDEWFEHLASASLLISGRFHYSIAAACLGTPFIAFEGNTPKLAALCDVLGEKAPLSYNDSDLTMKLRIAITKILREGTKKNDVQKQRLEMLCELGMKNFAAL